MRAFATRGGKGSASRPTAGPATASGRTGAHFDFSRVRIFRDAAAARPVVRRLILPEDVSGEMVGQPMLTTAAVTSPRGTEPAGSAVEVVSWDNASPTVLVRFPARPSDPAVDIEVPKTQLQPVRPMTPGIAPYSAGIPGQRRVLARGEAELAAERARPGGPRPGEIPRIEQFQVTRLGVLNRMLIQETMFNRFDPLIKQWTDYYNTAWGFTGPERLDPNLVKSMLYHESQMGTLGPHLLPAPPSGERKTRFNVGQVIDSSGPALLIMIEEMDPFLVTTHHLTHLRRDLQIAQARYKELAEMSTRAPAQNVTMRRLFELSEPKGNWERFFWKYRAAGEPTGFAEAVLEFFAPPPGGVSRNLDYEFWIRTAIRWLFEKRQNVSSWAEAVRAYNGSPEAAAAYRAAVTGRSAAAVGAERAGRPYVPTR